jgi:hypothetical protein
MGLQVPPLVEMALVTFIAFGGLIMGAGFLSGGHRGKLNTRFAKIISIDPLLLPKGVEEWLVDMGDKVAANVCFAGSFAIIATGALNAAGIIAIKGLVNLSGAVLLLDIIVAWCMRSIFVWRYRKTPKDKIPNWWFAKQR